MRYSVTTPPQRYPVSLAEVRKDLQLLHQEDDALLDGFVAAAVEEVETFLGRSLITRTYTGWLDSWPTLRFGCVTRTFDLPMPPLLAVSSIATFDDDDAETTFDPDGYFVDPTGYVGRIALRNSASWPTAERSANAIKVVWTAGYGPDMTDVPEVFRLGVRMIAASRKDNPDADPLFGGGDGKPAAPACALLRPHRLWNV